MVHELSRSRAHRIRRSFPAWVFPIAGTVGLLIAVLVAIFHR
jgi:hypothetical protein